MIRDVADEDLPILFNFQLDPDANYMAAFTAVDPTDRCAFDEHWKRIRADDKVVVQTVIVDGSVVGHIASFERFGQREVTYWIGKSYWGKGIATRALSAFLEEQQQRPIFARAAKDNVASLRVLKKCGFAITGEETGHANARDKEVQEYILSLSDSPPPSSRR